ncbi:MAG: hypothetical protein LBF78_03105 [Treponema sp.]|nr:hypothetical protein [Treponema sp.]
MDSLLSVNQSYQVSALAGSRSIDESALISLEQKIQPFFINPVKNDPDIAGLTITLKNAPGTEAVSSFLYTTEIKDGLPPFTLPEDLAPGPYMMIFTVMGHDKKIIVKAEKAIYYLADRPWELEDIKVYYPGVSATHLIPPGAMVLFEASVSAGDGLDPYIAWYSGRKRIGGGKLSDGAGKLLWEIPNQGGFVRIRAESLPFPPIDGQNPQSAYSPAGPVLKGKVRELSIPVSLKGEIGSALAPVIEAAETEDEKTLQYYYQFAGNLKDSKSAEKSSELVPVKTDAKGETPAPLWLASGTLYGLQVGPGNMYKSPAFPLETAPGYTEYFSFIFHLKPMADGILFDVSLGEIGMELSRKEGNAALTLTIGEQSETLNAEIPEGDEFITLPVDIALKTAAETNNALQDYLDEGSRLTVNFGGEEISLALPAPPRGLGSIRFGSEKAAVPATGAKLEPKEEAVKKDAEAAAETAELEAVNSETAELEAANFETTEPVIAPVLIKEPDFPVMILDEFVLLRWKEKTRIVASKALPEA